MSDHRQGQGEPQAPPEPDWPRRYAQALGEDLGGAEADVLLDLAREVAHGTERRFAPLSTFVAGRFVATRIAAGATAMDALAEAVEVARSLLADEEHTDERLQPPR
ncbi:MAG: DUF6457 domain-containing protein [Acidimicrobiales bacterium]